MDLTCQSCSSIIDRQSEVFHGATIMVCCDWRLVGGVKGTDRSGYDEIMPKLHDLEFGSQLTLEADLVAMLGDTPYSLG